MHRHWYLIVRIVPPLHVVAQIFVSSVPGLHRAVLVATFSTQLACEQAFEFHLVEQAVLVSVELL